MEINIHFLLPILVILLNDTQNLNAAFTAASSQMQNLARFSNIMSYTNSLPSTLLTGNVHYAREPDIQYSQFPVSHSMPTKYGSSVSSIGGSAISMSEALKSANSSMQPASQSLSGTGLATGPPLPQHIAVLPYSQPTLPLGPFANMIGYPFLPQIFSYMPSAYQQSFAGNNTYHQSLAALLPQYKSSVSVSSLPQSTSVPSGYGGLGSANSFSGNYTMNPPTSSSGSASNYEDVLSSQYKENSHLLSLQQGENPAIWLHGQGSRTVQPLPSNAYHNYPWVPEFLPFSDRNLTRSATKPKRCHSGASLVQPKPSQIWPNGY